ncbi:hypothetical protein GCM10023311_10980 [Flaviramulus aquimarinus]|uniref:Uncharacterized protein n=1 Tax=Flaviramulus aquimarinus TaxID=1170456 RepID=A0ABP9EWW4_9FLAO
MNKIRINYCSARINSQVFGSNNEHMISIVYFTIDGVSYESVLRQPFGGKDFSFEKDPIEVEVPEELKKNLNYEQFREVTEQYFRKLVGANALLFRISGGSNIQVTNSFLELNHSTEIDKSGLPGAW